MAMYEFYSLWFVLRQTIYRDDGGQIGSSALTFIIVVLSRSYKLMITVRTHKLLYTLDLVFRQRNSILCFLKYFIHCNQQNNYIVF